MLRDFQKGVPEDFLLINKPIGWTSFDVVAKIRSIYSKAYGKKIKVGHAGTLDPFATGLLIILVGAATKSQADFMKLDKEYEATLRLGKTSSTGDPEGQISEIKPGKYQAPKKPQIAKVLGKFIGKRVQIPPAYSAIKINGKRAYELARQGKKVKIKARRIEVYKLLLVSYDWPELKIKTKVSSGTYIRTLAEDIGKELGCGAYLSELKRIRIGPHKLENSQEVDDFSLT